MLQLTKILYFPERIDNRNHLQSTSCTTSYKGTRSTFSPVTKGFFICCLVSIFFSLVYFVIPPCTLKSERLRDFQWPKKLWPFSCVNISVNCSARLLPHCRVHPQKDIEGPLHVLNASLYWRQPNSCTKLSAHVINSWPHRPRPKKRERGQNYDNLQ